MDTTLTRLAAAARPATKVAAKAALKAAGLKQALAANLVAEANRLVVLRRNAPVDRLLRRFGHMPATGNRNTSAPVRLPSGTPAARLTSARIVAVKWCIKDHLRLGVHGVLQVRLTDDPRAVGWTQTDATDYDRYRGAYKGWACDYKISTVTVPARWRTRVERRGLAVLGGLVTLDAAPLDGAPVGVDLYAASWLQQSRGTSVTMVRGHIARSGQVSYHADTTERALAGLRRKIAGVEWAAKLQTADLADLVAAHPTATVRVADARAMGACEYGIRAWCAAVGLDYEAGAASIGAVYAGYLARPQPEARAAILRALRVARAH